MNERTRKVVNRERRAHRVRHNISGTPERPRMAIRITNMHISVQIIDDSQHKTLVSVTTVGGKLTGKTMTEKATTLGTEIAKKATAAKISSVVLDRGSKLYHGRVKAFADAAREAGLEF